MGEKTFFIREMYRQIFCSRVCLGQSFGELGDLLVFLNLGSRNGWSMDSISRDTRTQTSQVELWKN